MKMQDNMDKYGVVQMEEEVVNMCWILNGHLFHYFVAGLN